MAEFILERGNYWAIIGLMMIGLYISFSATNLIKRLVGLGLFQTSIILFYISLSSVDGGTAPIFFGKDYKKMTAIVVGVATLAVGLAIIVRIRETYGTIESDEIRQMDLEVAIAEDADEAEEARLGAGA